jgi:signal peptidase
LLGRVYRLKRKIKKAIKVVLLYIPCGLLFLLILMNLYLGINKSVTRDPVPMIFGYTPLVVLSGSMEPAIWPGDVVLIHKVRPDAYKLNDIATYIDGQTVYTHRIIQIENGLYTMKGDANNTTDEAIAADKLEGKVLLVIPKIGYLIVFVKKPAGMAIAAVLVVLIPYSGAIMKKFRKKPVEDE